MQTTAIATMTLGGLALNYVVALVQGFEPHPEHPEIMTRWIGNSRNVRQAIRVVEHLMPDESGYCPSTDWGQGGLLIEQHQIKLATLKFREDDSEEWGATIDSEMHIASPLNAYGRTPLEAACRVLVLRHFGECVAVPCEFLDDQAFDRNAERIAASVDDLFVSTINPDAKSVDDLFVYSQPDTEGDCRPAGGEVPEVVAYRVSMPEEPGLGHWFDEYAEKEPQELRYDPLMAVAQHERIVAALKAQAIKLSQELEASEKRGSELAAYSCDGVVGDDYGNAYCKYKAAIKGQEADLVLLADYLWRSSCGLSIPNYSALGRFPLDVAVKVRSTLGCQPEPTAVVKQQESHASGACDPNAPIGIDSEGGSHD